MTGAVGVMGIKNYLVVWILLGKILPSVGAEVRDCGELLVGNHLTPDQKFQAYLSDLLDGAVLGREELQVWEKGLADGRMENPVTEKLARMSFEAQIHRDSLEEYVRGESDTRGAAGMGEGKTGGDGAQQGREEHDREKDQGDPSGGDSARCEDGFPGGGNLHHGKSGKGTRTTQQ